MTVVIVNKEKKTYSNRQQKRAEKIIEYESYGYTYIFKSTWNRPCKDLEEFKIEIMSKSFDYFSVRHHSSPGTQKMSKKFIWVTKSNTRSSNVYKWSKIIYKKKWNGNAVDKKKIFLLLAKTLEWSLELKPVRCFVNIQHDPSSAFHPRFIPCSCRWEERIDKNKHHLEK